MATQPSAQALQLHEAACARGENGYIDPQTGYFVMTSVQLLRQGECCGNGCRHCPYDAAEQAEACRPEGPAWPCSLGADVLRQRFSIP